MLANDLRAPVRMVFACHVLKSLLKALNIFMDFCPLTDIHVVCFIFERKIEWIRRLHYVIFFWIHTHQSKGITGQERSATHERNSGAPRKNKR
jgi:hypothetical protein